MNPQSQVTSTKAAIRISQAGHDVTTCADWQMLFNSNWPSLQIAFDTTITVAASTNTTVIHNLGFPAFTMVSVSNSSGAFIGRAANVSQNYPLNKITITWNFDSNNVYLSNTDTSNSYQVNVKVYNLDITKVANYTLPTFAPINFPYDPTYGMKVAKEHKSISSPDLRDYILHTRCQSPAVLSIVTQPNPDNPDAPSGSISYVNPANYTPWAYAFGNDHDDVWVQIPPGNQNDGFVFEIGTIDSNMCYVNDTESRSMSLVVLRDPLNAKSQVRVVY